MNSHQFVKPDNVRVQYSYFNIHTMSPCW